MNLFPWCCSSSHRIFGAQQVSQRTMMHAQLRLAIGFEENYLCTAHGKTKKAHADVSCLLHEHRIWAMMRLCLPEASRPRKWAQPTCHLFQ